MGADEPLTYTLSTDTSGLPTLFSQGDAVSYAVVVNTARRRSLTTPLTATAGGRTVFTLVVNADGSWTFDLDDQLDHVDDGERRELCAAHGAGRQHSVCRRSTSRRSLWRPTGTATRSRWTPGQLHDRGSGRHSGSERGDGCGDGGGRRHERRGGRPPEGLNGNDLSTGNKEGGDTNADDETSGVLAGSLTGL